MKNYLTRYLDSVIEEKLTMIGAIVIVGPKWCGKTTTAKQHVNSALLLQDPASFESYAELSTLNPSKLLEGEKPRLIDEWQDIPVLWDAIRTDIDKKSEDGLYILTGSTVINENKIKHSGTGRFTRILMRPLSLFESKESNGKISILDLFENPDMDIDGIKSDLKYDDLIFALCRGGWPESLNKKTKEGQLFVAYNYLDNICDSDMSRIDGVRRDPNRVRTILKSFSRNISGLPSKKTILDDVHGNFPKMTYKTLDNYVEALSNLFVIDNISAWSPNIRSASSIRTSDKLSFIDPSIAVASLNLDPDSLSFDTKTAGFIFENLCARDLSVYTFSKGGEVSYFHDNKSDLEVDCILHLRNEDYALIEFKLGKKKINEGAENLIKLNNIIKESIDLGYVKMREPKFLAIVTGTEMAFTREDGVKILPIGCLR